MQNTKKRSALSPPSPTGYNKDHVKKYAVLNVYNKEELSRRYD